MAGIGDSWGTREELLHPRDSHGRFRTKWKMSTSVLDAVLRVTQNFRPRTFQSNGQATQYTQNLAHRKPERFQGGRGFSRLQADFFNANEDLLDGNPDEPSTKKFVQMMDASMQDIPEDIIVSQVVPPSAFGLTPDRLPELEEMTGNVIANRGYGAVNMGTPLGGGNGMISISVATPKGTKMAIPGRDPNDRAMFFDRDQEFTVTKVKPDGRGGYYMWAVATPKTPGENPAPQGTGHAGPGKPPDREKAISELENAANSRLMGEQDPSQLPDGQAPAAAPATSPEQERAARRAQVLGRPAEPAPAPSGQPEAATPAPVQPNTPEPTAPPAAAPSVPATPTPEAPAPTGVEPPNGATSLVTGNPATSFRDAFDEADLDAPLSPARRREFNSAVSGISGDKVTPRDALRNLEADIERNKADQDSQTGMADRHLATDIERQEKLADLIRSHFSLPAKQRQARSDVIKEIDARAAKTKAETSRPAGGRDREPGEPSAIEEAQAARKAARPPAAPPRAESLPDRQKRLQAERDKDIEDDRLNAEKRQEWQQEVGPEPEKMGAGDILLDEVADLLRNGRTTKPKAAARLRDQAREDDTPEADYLRKVADAIEADEEPLPKRVPLKKVTRAAPDTEKAEASLAGRTEKNILTGLNGLSVGDLRALAEKWGVETRSEKKLKLKSALAKDLAAKWKATPELQRKVEGEPDVNLDKMTIAQLKEHAKAQGINLPSGLLKRQILGRIRGQEEEKSKTPTPETATAEEALSRAETPAKKAVKAAKKAAPKAAAKKATPAAPEEPEPAPVAKKATPAVQAAEVLADSPDTPPILKKAAKKVAAKQAKKPTEQELVDFLANLPEPTEAQKQEALQRAIDNPLTAEELREGMKANSLPQLRAMVDDLGVVSRHKTRKQLQDIIIENEMAQRAAKSAKSPVKSAKKAAPARKALAPKVSEDPEQDLVDNLRQAGDEVRRAQVRVNDTDPDTADFDDAQQLLDAARDAEDHAQEELDSFRSLKKISDRAPAAPVKKITPAVVAEVKQEVAETKTPKKVSSADRIAAELLARLPVDARRELWDGLSEGDKQRLTDAADLMDLQMKQVKSGAPHVLEELLEGSGRSIPHTLNDDVLAQQLRRLFAENKTTQAKRVLTQEARRLNTGITDALRTSENQNVTDFERRAARTKAKELQDTHDWVTAVREKLGAPQGAAGKTGKQLKQEILIELDAEEMKQWKAATVDDLRAVAKLQGVKLPPGELTKDQIATEVARDMVRREMAGKSLSPVLPETAPKAPEPTKRTSGPVDILSAKSPEGAVRRDVFERMDRGETTPQEGARELRLNASAWRQKRDAVKKDKTLSPEARAEEAARHNETARQYDLAAKDARARKPVAKQEVLQEVLAEVAKKDAPKPVKKTAPKKATPPAPEAPPAPAAVESQVEQRRVTKAAQADVAQEVAEAMAPAKKTAKKAAAKAVSGSARKYTQDELQDMNLAEIKDIEDERGIKRTSVARGDRIAAILADQDAAPAPVKKAAKKAAAPTPATDGPTSTPAKAAKKAVKSLPPGPLPKSVILRTDSNYPRTRPKADEPIHLPNNGADQGNMHFDSTMGQLWQALYNDDRVPNSYINEIARMGDQMGQHKLPERDVIKRLRAMADEAPDQGIAKAVLAAADTMDGPATLPNFPDGVPESLRAAILRINDEIPSARKRSGRLGSVYINEKDGSIVDRKVQAIRDIMDGKYTRLAEAKEALDRRDFHESSDAATTMWQIMETALAQKIVTGYKQKPSGGYEPIEADNPGAVEIDRWLKEQIRLAREKATRERQGR